MQSVLVAPAGLRVPAASCNATVPVVTAATTRVAPLPGRSSHSIRAGRSGDRAMVPSPWRRGEHHAHRDGDGTIRARQRS